MFDEVRLSSGRGTAVALGRGTLIAKIDIKAAYRLVPVNPQDRLWLATKWDGGMYIDCMLPFGLRSAPKIFNALADALEWVVAKEGVEHIYHYLDDYAMVGPPDSTACQCYLDTMTRVCSDLGVPLAPEKQEGPSTIITFLGIEIDTVRQRLRLPKEKLERLITLIHELERKKACTRQELESLIGSLQHACTVVRAGKSFLCRIISLLSVTRHKHHHIRLNKEFRSDILWWKVFAAHWNGTSIIVSDSSECLEMTSDASGTWGCGAWHLTEWFQLPWNVDSCKLQIAVKELIPIIIGAVVWGPTWRGKNIRARCDNAAVVAIVNSRCSKEPLLMHMLGCLFFVEATISLLSLQLTCQEHKTTRLMTFPGAKHNHF